MATKLLLTCEIVLKKMSLQNHANRATGIILASLTLSGIEINRVELKAYDYKISSFPISLSSAGRCNIFGRCQSRDPKVPVQLLDGQRWEMFTLLKPTNLITCNLQL